jgi:hypothetical protein
MHDRAWRGASGQLRAGLPSLLDRDVKEDDCPRNTRKAAKKEEDIAREIRERTRNKKEDLVPANNANERE